MQVQLVGAVPASSTFSPITPEFFSELPKKRCEMKTCTSAPKYAFLGEKPRYCREHCLPGMIHAISKKCKHAGCTKSPSYAMPGGRPQYCKSHKTPEMINVKKKLCREEGCNKQPSYGFKNQGGPQYCHGHRKTGMITLMNKLCEQEGCMKHPTYGFPGDKPKYCKGHSLPGMRDVKRKICEEPECRKTPSFAFHGQRPRFCKIHMKTGMINIVSKSCEEPNCSKPQQYGVEGGKPQFCQEHLKEGMVNLKGKRKAVRDSTTPPKCPEQATVSTQLETHQLDLIQTAIDLNNSSISQPQPIVQLKPETKNEEEIKEASGSEIQNPPLQSRPDVLNTNFCHPFSFSPRSMTVPSVDFPPFAYHPYLDPVHSPMFFQPPMMSPAMMQITPHHDSPRFRMPIDIANLPPHNQPFLNDPYFRHGISSFPLTRAPHSHDRMVDFISPCNADLRREPPSFRSFKDDSKSSNPTSNEANPASNETNSNLIEMNPNSNKANPNTNESNPTKREGDLNINEANAMSDEVHPNSNVVSEVSLSQEQIKEENDHEKESGPDIAKSCSIPASESMSKSSTANISSLAENDKESTGRPNSEGQEVSFEGNTSQISAQTFENDMTKDGETSMAQTSSTAAQPHRNSKKRPLSVTTDMMENFVRPGPDGSLPHMFPPPPWSPYDRFNHGYDPIPMTPMNMNFFESSIFRDMPLTNPYYYPPDPRMAWCGTPGAAYLNAQERALMMGPLESPRFHPGMIGMRLMEGFPTTN